MEHWLPVSGYEGIYEVSSLGRVKSLARSTVYPSGARRKYSERIMKSYVTRDGYARVALSFAGTTKLFLVHRLVALAFLDSPEVDEEVCHGDGDRQNNHVENLRWGTRYDNMQDALKHGTNHNASKMHCKRNHEFTEENTFHRKDGGRDCKTCGRERMRVRYLHTKKEEVF